LQVEGVGSCWKMHLLCLVFGLVEVQICNALVCVLVDHGNVAKAREVLNIIILSAQVVE